MSQLDLNSYESQISQLAQTLQSVQNKADEKFKHQTTSNEITKTIGEAKTFISGKPVAKYLFKKGESALKPLIEKGNLKVDEFKESIQKTISGKFEEAVSSIKSKFNAATDGIGVPADDLAVSRYTPTIESNYGAAAESRIMSNGSLENVSPKAPDVIGEPIVPDVVAAPDAAPADVIATKIAPKVEDEEVGEGAEEAVAGVLDAIPGADVVGLLVGGGIALGAMLKKPREHNPVDNVNASFQLGI